jgi:hypothetical protein
MVAKTCENFLENPLLKSEIVAKNFDKIYTIGLSLTTLVRF